MEEEINKKVEENIKSLLASGQLFPKTVLNMLADFHSNPQTKKAIHH
ncbi:4598_t:CDS:2, partial [Ambispora leptoticha]